MEQCENVFKDMLTCRKIQFTRFCADAAFVRRVSIAMIYNTIHDVNDGLMVRPQLAENTHYLTKIQIPGSMQ